MAELLGRLQEAQTEASMQLLFSGAMLTEIATALPNCEASPIKTAKPKEVEIS